MPEANRSRAKVSYAEYSDDESESPVKKVGKKRVIESDSDEQEVVAKEATGILKFAKPGVANTFLPEKSSSPSPMNKNNAANRRNRHKRLTRCVTNRHVHVFKIQLFKFV